MWCGLNLADWQKKILGNSARSKEENNHLVIGWVLHQGKHTTYSNVPAITAQEIMQSKNAIQWNHLTVMSLRQKTINVFCLRLITLRCQFGSNYWNQTGKNSWKTSLNIFNPQHSTLLTIKAGWPCSIYIEVAVAVKTKEHNIHEHNSVCIKQKFEILHTYIIYTVCFFQNADFSLGYFKVPENGTKIIFSALLFQDTAELSYWKFPQKPTLCSLLHVLGIVQTCHMSQRRHWER